MSISRRLIGILLFLMLLVTWIGYTSRDPRGTVIRLLDLIQGAIIAQFVLWITGRSDKPGGQ